MGGVRGTNIVVRVEPAQGLNGIDRYVVRASSPIHSDPMPAKMRGFFSRDINEMRCPGSVSSGEIEVEPAHLT